LRHNVRELMNVDTQLKVDVLTDWSIVDHNLNPWIELVAHPPASVVPVEAAKVGELIERIHKIAVAPPVDLVRLCLAVRVLLVTLGGQVLDALLVGGVKLCGPLLGALCANPLAGTVEDLRGASTGPVA